MLAPDRSAAWYALVWVERSMSVLAMYTVCTLRLSQAIDMEGIGEPGRVIKLREHAWKYEPSEIRIKRGEVVKIEFSATDNGLGAGHGFAIDGLDQNVFINGAMAGAPLSVTFKVDNPGRYNFYCSTQCSTTELHPHMHGVLVVE